LNISDSDLIERIARF